MEILWYNEIVVLDIPLLLIGKSTESWYGTTTKKLTTYVSSILSCIPKDKYEKNEDGRTDKMIPIYHTHTMGLGKDSKTEFNENQQKIVNLKLFDKMC